MIPSVLPAVEGSNGYWWIRARGGSFSSGAEITAASRRAKRRKDQRSPCVFFFFLLSLDLDLLRIGHTVFPFCSYIARMILVRTFQKKHRVTESGAVSNANIPHGPVIHAVMSNILRVT